MVTLGYFIVSVVASFSGALITIMLQFATKRLHEHRSPFTGPWEDRIYDDAGHVVKKDLFELRQRGESLHGLIRRFYPDDQSLRKWDFVGRIRGQHLFGTFWSTDASVPSYGSCFLRQISETLLRGYYLRFDEDTGEVRPIRFELVRRLRCQNCGCDLRPRHPVTCPKCGEPSGWGT